jgi:hypothetical protein
MGPHERVSGSLHLGKHDGRPTSRTPTARLTPVTTRGQALPTLLRQRLGCRSVAGEAVDATAAAAWGNVGAAIHSAAVAAVVG